MHAKHALFHLSYIPIHSLVLLTSYSLFGKNIIVEVLLFEPHGDVAQMVERVLSMHEAQGSIPCFSTFLSFFFGLFVFVKYI